MQAGFSISNQYYFNIKDLNAGIFLQKLSLLVIFMSLSIFGFSQLNDSLKATGNQRKLNVTDIKDLTKDGFNFWQDKFTGHFSGIDFGFNTCMNQSYSLYPEEDEGFMDNNFFRSNSLFFNIVQQSIGLQHNRNTIGLVTGLGLQLQSFRLHQNITIKQPSYGKIVPEPLAYEENQKSKLSMAYIVLPLLAEFQIPVKNYANRLYLSGGFYAGLRVSSHTKIKYRKLGQKEKLKTPDDFSLRKIKSGVMFRMGYRWINFFATYDLTTLFKEDLGPELTPVTVGITLIQF